MDHIFHNSSFGLERSRTQYAKKIVIVFLLLFGLLKISGLAAQERRFKVNGEISFPKKGAIMIQLVTKEEFESNKTAPFASLIEVGPEDVEKKKTSFSFTDVPAGAYGITCFQDLNGNGILDKGTFGPVEPWGTYRPSRPTFRAPTFEEIAFHVDKDMTDIEVELK